MRGVAAVLVVLRHLGQDYGSNKLSGGYLAVDLFFVLSGFVIGGRYQVRLAEGLTFFRFLKARIVRLYPAYLIGLLIALASALLARAMNLQGHYRIGEILKSFIPNLLFVPSVFSKSLYLINPPSWSLFYELVANVIFAAFAYRLGSKVLLATALATFGVLALLVQPPHFASIGWDLNLHSAAGGLARVTYSFIVGLLIARMRHVDRRRSWVSIALLAVIVVYFAIPGLGRFTSARDLLFIDVLSPALVFVGTRVEPPAFAERACAVLGDISYPLYTIHYLQAAAFVQIGLRLGAPHNLISGVVIVCLAGEALLVAYVIDRPARLFIEKSMGLFRSAPTQGHR